MLEQSIHHGGATAADNATARPAAMFHPKSV